jgi:hypothetical protein
VEGCYFGISLNAAAEVGDEASEFTKRTLAKPFTTYTRWRRALGRSANWRYYAIVITADGHDLNELLVSNVSQRLILTGEPSSLQTHIATTESVSIAVRTKGLPLFLTIALFRSSLGPKVF